MADQLYSEGSFGYIPSRDSTGSITGIRSIPKMRSYVRYCSLASGVVEAAVAILETAQPIARVWVIAYELLKLLNSGFLVLL